MSYYLLAKAFIILLFIYFLFFKKKNKLKRHARNIQSGDNILAKLNSIKFNGAKINYLRKIDPYIFEELILCAFQKKGFRIKRNKKYSGDGGIDGIIYDENNLVYLIQCNRYNSYISKQDILDFKNLVYTHNFERGFFVILEKLRRIY